MDYLRYAKDPDNTAKNTGEIITAGTTWKPLVEKCVKWILEKHNPLPNENVAARQNILLILGGANYLGFTYLVKATAKVIADLLKAGGDQPTKYMGFTIQSVSLEEAKDAVKRSDDLSERKAETDEEKINARAENIVKVSQVLTAVN
jgi:hypothetical protein